MSSSTKPDMALIAHLHRRAGFGATYDQIEACTARGYAATVEELLHPEAQPDIDEYLMLRAQPGWQDLGSPEINQAYWVYRAINTKRPLVEKMALFWHGILCTGHPKLDFARQMTVTINMFRQHGLGNFRELLSHLAKDPGMIYYLDNCVSHKGAINENWGRELLELFSMGVGNYTENDIKEAARAFTGWTNSPTLPAYPYGRTEWQFKYDASDHDNREKAFMGRRGRLNGEDIVHVICQQPATARFIARHLYNFFVADEAPVPQWSNTPPRDPQAIDILVNAYFHSGYDIRSVLRVLFNSNFFKNTRFAKVKSPAEVVVGTMRVVKSCDAPKPGLFQITQECRYMGQELLNPPTVEGWHTGQEWIDSGALVERVNFVSGQVGDPTQPGIQEIVERLRSRKPYMSGEELVDGCLELLGLDNLRDATKSSLIAFAQRGGAIQTGSQEFGSRVATLLQLIVSTVEYQFC